VKRYCAHCRQFVDPGEGVVDEYIWYHTRCYYLVKSKRSDVLKKKFKGGTITLDEAEELVDLEIILPNVSKFLREPEIRLGRILGQNPPVVFGRSKGLEMIDKHITELKKHRELEAARTDEQKKLPAPKNRLLEIADNAKTLV